MCDSKFFILVVDSQYYIVLIVCISKLMKQYLHIYFVLKQTSVELSCEYVAHYLLDNHQIDSLRSYLKGEGKIVVMQVVLHFYYERLLA